MSSIVSAAQKDRQELVSVIVPCFNAARFVGETIESVLAQSYAHFELIVVDDQSTDESVAIVRSYMQRDDRIVLIQMEKHCRAPAAPRNRGVRAARGVWVAFLDADDLWHPSKLEQQMLALSDAGTAMCSTQMRDFKRIDEISLDKLEGPCEVEKVDLLMQMMKYRTPTSSVVVRRDLMLRNPFNEDLRYKAREDTDCFIRMHELMDYSIKLRYPLMFYRVQGSQISGNKLKMVARHLHMLRRYRLQSGRSLGLKAYLFTFTHFASSIYFRLMRRML